MGNSEVGHMNLGAGRIVYQDLTRIDAAIEDGSFFANDEPARGLRAAREHGARCTCSACSRPAACTATRTTCSRCWNWRRRERVPQVAVHAFLDGRDMPPNRRNPACARCRPRAARTATRPSPRSAAATTRWTATTAGTACAARGTRSSTRAGEAARARCGAGAGRGPCPRRDRRVRAADRDRRRARVEDGDAVVFMNFRADRARQLTAAFVDPAFAGFEARRPRLSRFVCLTEYDAGLPAPVAFPPTTRTTRWANWCPRRAHPIAHRRDREIRARHLLLRRRARGAVPGRGTHPRAEPKVATYDLQRRK